MISWRPTSGGQMTYRPFATFSLAVAFLTTASLAHAQSQPAIEIGAPLLSGGVSFGDDTTTTTVGAPTGIFGFTTPAVYLSFFTSERVAIEPQVSAVWAFSDSDSAHLANVGVQVDYFLQGTKQRSPYVFAAVSIAEQ